MCVCVCVCVCTLGTHSCLTLCDMNRQVPLSMEFSRQEYWNVKPFCSPGDLPNPDIETRSPALQADSSLSEPQGPSGRGKRGLNEKKRLGICFKVPQSSTPCSRHILFCTDFLLLPPEPKLQSTLRSLSAPCPCPQWPPQSTMSSPTL